MTTNKPHTLDDGKDSDAVAALAKLKAYVVRIRLYHKAQDYTTIDDDEALEIIAALNSSSPTKTLKQVAQKIDDAHSEVYYIWNTFGDRFTPIQLNHLESALKLLSEVLAILTTSTDETDGKGGTG